MLGGNGFEKWYLGCYGPILGCHDVVVIVVVEVVVVVVVFNGLIHLELLPFWNLGPITIQFHVNKLAE